ncbi:MAG: hypothetical protein Q9171_003115 [Xanthocarpia ochracea]
MKEQLLQDAAKMRLVEEKARKCAGVARIYLPDQEFARASPANMDSKQTPTTTEARFANSRREVEILSIRWEPMLFAKGANVRRTTTRDAAGISAIVKLKAEEHDKVSIGLSKAAVRSITAQAHNPENFE